MMLPEGFIERLASFAGRDAAGRFREAMETPASVSVRLNPFKTPDSALPILEGSTPVPWCRFGHILSKRPVFTLHPLFHAGAYYVQDSSAMFVGRLFRQLLPEFLPAKGDKVRVLDLCAAPGGKTTDLASSCRLAFGDAFLLVANEVMSKRASVLSDNVAVWGDPNVVVTSVDPGAFAGMEGFFDIIVADVPCSGEGMFRKDSKAVADWSQDTVDLCAARQKRIISDVWPALRPSGLLVYSTCTFAEKEDDGLVAWIGENLGAQCLTPLAGLSYDGVLETGTGYLLVPGLVPGEGQYAAAVRKDGSSSRSRCTDADLLRLKPLRAGLNKGVMKGHDFVPDPDWALSIAYDRDFYPEVEVDKQTALHFLHKDSLHLPSAPSGYLTLTYRGLPIGFVKNLGSRCNNLHPQSRRILMDVNL